MNDDETYDSSGNDLERVRDLILTAHADVVPELIVGSTIQELVDSIGSARGAYENVIARMAKPTPPAVPAGSAVALVDPSTLPAHELIRRGLRTPRK